MDTQTATNELTATLPPVAPRRPSQHTVHGVTLVDDYAWLKDAKWQEVLRNPALLDPDITRIATPRRFSNRRASCRRR
jgi:oligopeptidase B